MKRYDAVVIGGGFAGVAAALAAKREGAQVLIIEKGNCFGGAAVNCLVNPFMPFSTEINGVEQKLSAGIFEEICQRLKERNAMSYLSFLEEELKLILNDMLCQAGVDILFHSCIVGVQTDKEYIKSISVATRAGTEYIEADYFVDATGDAQTAYLAGCPTALGRAVDNLCQPMTLCFRLGNVDVDRFMSSLDCVQALYRQARDKGEITNPRENILVFKIPAPGVLHFNTTRVVKLNPTNACDITRAEIIAREQVYELYEFMKQNADGLENSFLMMTASEIGVRESRKIIGDYVLTEDDCRAFAKFYDGVAACNYDIDIHNPEGSGTSHYYFPQGEYYTIPYRCLIPKGVKNMLVAGRCISSDHGAQASYRIMPTVCSIGEAAGVAVGLAVKHQTDVRGVDVQEIRRVLSDNGAFVGKVDIGLY